MNKTAIVVAIVVVLAAMAIALILRPTGSVRFEALERRLEALERQVAGLDAGPVDTDLVARLDAVEANVAEKQIENEAVPFKPDEQKRDVMVRLQHIEHSVAKADRALSNTIDERVAAVVDERVSELAEKQIIMQNKEPSLDNFAEALDLTDSQRLVVEDEVWFGQNEVRTILDIPTADGSNLVDELVEALAYGGVKHPETSKRFMKWVGRVMSEKVPGTDDTYGAHIEVAKNKVREGFRRAFTDKQYAKFEKWGLDPTEIKEIENSPWADIGELIKQRMLELNE